MEGILEIIYFNGLILFIHKERVELFNQREHREYMGFGYQQPWIKSGSTTCSIVTIKFLITWGQFNISSKQGHSWRGKEDTDDKYAGTVGIKQGYFWQTRLIVTCIVSDTDIIG